jgi:flavodoxin
MKRVAFLITVIASAMSVIACGGNKQKENISMKENNEKNVLVAYFSATGNTRATAKILANAAGADLFEIEPEKPYTSADLNWQDKKSRSSVEMQNKKSRPAIKNKVEHWEQYKTVYLGFPIWWYTCPTIINTFLEQYDLKGKTIIPFATSGGSSVSGALRDLKKAYPQATWKEGITNPSEEEIKNFVKGL